MTDKSNNLEKAGEHQNLEQPTFQVSNKDTKKDNEIGKQMPFKCDSCGEHWNLESFIMAVASYGIIFLVGMNDGYFGTVCPNPECLKTSLKQRDRKTIESLKTYLFLESRGFEGDSKSGLRYHSVPGHFYYHTGESVNQIHVALEELIGRPEYLKWYDTPDYDLDSQPTFLEGYCSYFYGDLAMGPAMEVRWFGGDRVADLMKVENQTGMKVFPRYSLYNDLFISVENYCWRHYLQLWYADSFNKDDPFIPMTIDIPDPWQRKVTRIFEFLNLLCLRPPLSTSIRYNALFSEAEEVLNKKEEIMTKELAGAEHLVSEFWKRFNKLYTDQMLYSMSDKFISEYIQQSQRTDFSRLDVWKLIGNCLKKIVSSTKSRYKRAEVQKTLLEDQLKHVKEAEKQCPAFEKIISRDYDVNKLKIDFYKMAKVENEDATFLLLGESGTGKELFAKAIHEASGRKGKFVVCDCGLKSENLFESELFGHVKGSYTGAVKDRKGDFERADGGTIFLDEIGNLNSSVQPKLLRVLREKEIQPLGAEYTKKINAKVVLATNKDLDKMVSEGTFIHDLYSRFKRPSFLIPPLRERKGDISLLVEAFIEKHDVKRKEDPDLPPIRVTKEAMALLSKYEWRDGNVGELERVILGIMLERAGYDSRKDIIPSDLPSDILELTNSNEINEKAKKDPYKKMKANDESIILSMKRNNNNKSAVARELGYSVRRIRDRCKPLVDSGLLPE